MNKKTIQIKCEGKTFLPLDAILEFQGNLKRISKDNLQRLKNNIITNGFIAPMFVWDDRGDYKLLDGHGRIKALISLRQEDYDIPLLPVDFIHAENEKQARQMLLSITSQYGEFEADQLKEWLGELDEGTAELLRLVDGEEVTIVDMDTHSEKIKSENINPYKKVHILISINQDQFFDIAENLKKIKEIEGVEYEQSQN